MSAATWSRSAGWAQYLVDKGLVKQGDFVWMPVEVPGATYGVQEEEGIARSSSRSGITWEVTDNTLDQAEVITRMTDYLTANRAKIKAIIGLGDLVTGSIKRVFDQVGVAPGEIPVVGWGNSLDTTQEVLDGYVNAGMWQDPQATSYIGLSMAAMAAPASRPASTSSPARSTRRTRRSSTTTSCRATDQRRAPGAAPARRLLAGTGIRREPQSAGGAARIRAVSSCSSSSSSCSRRSTRTSCRATSATR